MVDNNGNILLLRVCMRRHNANRFLCSKQRLVGGGLTPKLPYILMSYIIKFVPHSSTAFTIMFGLPIIGARHPLPKTQAAAFMGLELT